MSWLESKEATLRRLEGYAPEELDSYNDEVENNFYGEEPFTFLEFIDDRMFFMSQDFQNYLDNLK